MKMFLYAFPFLLCAPFAQAQISIFNWTVLAKDSITASCSDYQGRTAAGGAVALRDFQITKADKHIGCALESNASVNWLRGSVLDQKGQTSCVVAPKLELNQVNANKGFRYVAPYDSIDSQMNDMSDFFAVDGNSDGIKRVFLKLPAHPGGVIRLNGNAHELLVVNILEKKVSIVDSDLVLSGGIGATNIIWNFPNATQLLISHSGNAEFGLAGTFLAPRADVTFLNGKITGALFANRIIGNSDGNSCENSKVKAGQINGVCINGLIAGIGCGCADYHANEPVPSPTPTPNCQSGQRQSPCPAR